MHFPPRHEQLKKLSLAHNVIRIIPDLRENPLLARVYPLVITHSLLPSLTGRLQTLYGNALGFWAPSRDATLRVTRGAQHGTRERAGATRAGHRVRAKKPGHANGKPGGVAPQTTT